MAPAAPPTPARPASPPAAFAQGPPPRARKSLTQALRDDMRELTTFLGSGAGAAARRVRPRVA